MSIMIKSLFIKLFFLAHIQLFFLPSRKLENCHKTGRKKLQVNELITFTNFVSVHTK